ncbi:L-rhamnose-binding lectin CSL3-like isoform X2 [Acanthopagrus latus]|uniref:L-rhamnose-binding lectin CSL3-like isoform X2 n=1 Tax=Acanthopagrus latus TaxID=8177 RepID=UPI00187C14AB|nr:L-rhamnose-binding lectin CSL3-like isoform X2 [Acanthopagrus latus]
MLAIKLMILAFLAAAWAPTVGGFRVDVACPGVNNELRCPEGSTIHIRYLTHGSQSTKICAARHKRARTPRMNCLQPGLRPWFRLICDKTQHCRLPKPDVRMFRPNCGDPKTQFIQVHYICRKNRGDVYNAVACEGQDAQMKCDKGCIKVIKAYFGRHDETTCNNTPTKMTFCTSYTADTYVKKTCNKQKVCDVKAVAETLGTPVKCDALPKYLYVDYVCQQRCH